MELKDIDQDDEFVCILGEVGLDEIQCAAPDMSLELLGIVRTFVAVMAPPEGSHGELCAMEDSCQEFFSLFSL